MKTISLIIFLLLFPILAFADCTIIIKCGESEIQGEINCDGFIYDKCKLTQETLDNGEVFTTAMCCTTDRGILKEKECIFLMIPTSKVGM